MINNVFNVVSVRPFVKWVGGKTQLLPALTNSLPKFSRYHEPFVGGGAMFFHLYAKGLIKDAYLYDYNEDLLNLYQVIKTNPLDLINELKSKKYSNTEEAFYNMRSLSPEDVVEKAARFMYLNRTAFNGLYRVNSKGGFNVPFGRYKKLSLPSTALLLKDSEALHNVNLIKGDFSNVLEYAKQGDLVYFDPPYQPVSKTASFTNYTASNFLEPDQERLANIFKKLDKKGCYVMLSNSSTELITSLYSNYHIEEVLASRVINCKPEGRGKIKEFIVRNWEIRKQQKQLHELKEFAPIKA